MNNSSSDIENQDHHSPNPLSFSTTTLPAKIRKLSDPTVFIDLRNDISTSNNSIDLDNSNNSINYDVNNNNNNNNNNNDTPQTIYKTSSFTMTKSGSSIPIVSTPSTSTSPSLSSSLSNIPPTSAASKSNKNGKPRTVICLVSIVLVCTQLLGIFLFAQGFFPRKSSLEGYNSFKSYATSCTENDDIKVEAQYGRLVFMLVDAFRSNLLFTEDAKEEMKFTRNLIDTGKAYSYIARANAPTVTLPRVKALLSGGIPSFVDFVNNFNSKDLKDDNILWQMKNTANKSMIFYGDDTWLKLFPDHFKRSEGTTSFYVADTVEVDQNVTRHLDEEFQNYKDWDAMFLHYLGLDHIGHLEGPYSSLMKPKQREMDNVIEKIHSEILRIDQLEMDEYNLIRENISSPLYHKIKKPLPTLFVFCSDHGMNEVGNHGGSTDSETSAILVLMSSTYYHQNDPIPSHHVNNHTNNEQDEQEEEPTETHSFGRVIESHGENDILPKSSEIKIGREVDQVDLVPSLSFLFNLPIPKNSLGKVIPELLEKFIPTEQYLRALEINCQQQIELLKTNSIFWNKKENKPLNQNIQNLINLFTDAQQYHSSYSMTPSHSHFNENASKLYKEFLDRIHQEFSRLLTSFDENLLIIGLLSIGSSALVTLLISTATISMSEHPGSILEIKGVSFALTFIGIIAGIIALHFGFICSGDMEDKYYCTKDFRYVLLSFICTTLSLLIGLNAIISRNNLKLWTNQGIAQLRKEKYIIIFGTGLHLVSLFGSSLVEEEHQTWYYLTTSVILLQITPHSISILTYFNNLYNKSTSGNINTLSMSKHNSLQFQTKVSYKQMFILLGILLTLRVMRVWNQTGIKWLDDPLLTDSTHFVDFGRYLNSNRFSSNLLLWIFSLISIIAPCIYVFKLLDELKDQKGGILSNISFLYKIIMVILSISLFCYKWDYIPTELIQGVYVARIVYFCVFVLMLITFTFPFFSKKDRITTMNVNVPPSWFIATLKYVPTLIVVNLTMLFLLIHRTHNMMVLTMMGGISHYYIKYLLEDTGRRAKSGMIGVAVGLICINWLGQFGYFSLGNSNSLSTIDISGSYTGVIDYNQYVVGSLTFLIGYTSQIYFFFVGLVYSTHLAVKSISNTGGGSQQEYSSLPNNIGSSQDIIDELQWYSLVGTLLDCGLKWTNVFVFSLCVIVQRFHLFIWTVFSPKYIYEVLDVSLVLVKAILLALFIIYLRILTSIREKSIYENILNQSSSNLNKEE